MRRVTLAMTTASLLLGASAVQAKDKGLEEAYVEAMECRVAASVMMLLPKSDELSQEEQDLLSKVEAAETFYGLASLWLGSKLDKDADRVKTELAVGILGATGRVLESSEEVLELGKTAISCAEVVQEAES